MQEFREADLAIIQRLRVSAIIRTASRKLAADAMRAAVDGGFCMVEFTLNTPGALELISEFSRSGDLLVGAGTVLTPDQVRAAVDAGARFIVSPVFDADVIACAAELGVISIPGTFTPSEMLAAVRLGADVVKLFPTPADIALYLRQVLAPLPHLRVFPTAGVSPDNFVEILQAGAFGVGFVSSLFRPEDLERGAFQAIRRRAEWIVERLDEHRNASPPRDPK